LHAVRLFEEACFKNFGVPQRVAAWANTAVLLEMPKEAAASFFASGPGRAWGATNAIGNFVVVSYESGLCTVYARRAKAALVKELYLAFLPKPSIGLTPEKKLEETKSTPNGELYTLAHEITGEKAAVTMSTVLSTSESENAPMQAILSLSIRKK